MMEYCSCEKALANHYSPDRFTNFEISIVVPCDELYLKDTKEGGSMDFKVMDV